MKRTHMEGVNTASANDVSTARPPTTANPAGVCCQEFATRIQNAEIVAPTIFNTGQVLFGLSRAARETGDGTLRAALERAADWLVAAQDDDGCWRRFPSPFTTTGTATYNTRCAFGLVRSFAVLGKESYLAAATRNIEWALGQARANHWLPGNCLTANADDSALTHTIAYSIRGILEVGATLKRAEFLDAALAMARSVATTQRGDGSLPAYLLPNWSAKTRWSCVTGNAQMAINWQRLAQDLETGDLDRRGAIKGSHPLDGGYMTYRYPNWAAKFFMDALMLEVLFDSTREIG